jgi:flavin reductase (DIM6/NTAB) family NADH-FMN oxidoreductase RutF
MDDDVVVVDVIVVVDDASGLVESKANAKRLLLPPKPTTGNSSPLSFTSHLTSGIEHVPVVSTSVAGDVVVVVFSSSVVVLSFIPALASISLRNSHLIANSMSEF